MFPGWVRYGTFFNENNTWWKYFKDWAAYKSRLIVFDTQNETDVLYKESKPAADAKANELKGWTLRMKHVNGTETIRKVDELFNLADDNSTQSFAGELYYEKVLDDDVSGYVWLDLGKVHGVSEVAVIDADKEADKENGAGKENIDPKTTALGKHYYGRHLYKLPDNAAGKKLQIKITTTLGNYLKATPQFKSVQHWVRNQPYAPNGLIGPVKILE
ncbi:MAG: hypothetical protein LBQ54_02575 [Planctomycetaceae bacterium]|jgi:hypothetical protein|nr:hypothetical protein [Planctomycetaceae bacterium]